MKMIADNYDDDAPMARFTAIDHNGDGAISMDEANDFMMNATSPVRHMIFDI